MLRLPKLKLLKSMLQTPITPKQSQLIALKSLSGLLK